MCGRFTITMSALDIERVMESDFGIQNAPVEDVPRYNVAPTQNALAILKAKNQYRFGSLKWGFSFSNHLTINTRIETAMEKDYFKTLLDHQRVLLLSQGYFEWDQETKDPFYIHYKNQAPMYLGAIWRRHHDSFECSIITLEATSNLKNIHPRMPLSMTLDNAKKWLAGEDTFQSLDVPSEILKLSKVVNKVTSNTEQIFK